MAHITLENDSLRLEFTRATGALVGVTALRTNWRVLDRPELGLSFRLLVPLPDRRNNQVLGESQAPPQIDVSATGDQARFVWQSVTAEFAGPLDIQVTLNVTLSQHQATFAVTIDNRSPYIVENVYCPYLGDLQRPEGAEWFRTFLYRYATAQEWPLWPHFQNMRGYYGVDYPTQVSEWTAGCGTPMSPFILLRDLRQGLYVGAAEATSELVAWHAELRPGYDSSIDARVPAGKVIGGKDVATRFAAVHIPYIQPGECRALTPIVLAPYVGGWQAGVDVYTAWQRTWLRLPDAPNWVREPHSWQQLHINSPEDELRVQFRDLVRFGEDCARHGVRAIQLVGWNDGGQDQGNPSHDPDPRLGTSDELKTAIARIQALGVKVVLFTKFTWADRATERFRRDLHRLAVKDPYGDHYVYRGYMYQTMTQLLDINTKRLVPMCFLSEEYLRVCEQEFQTVLDLGADGMLFDECLHHSPALLCFDTSHGHRYGAPVYANDRELIWRLGAMARKVRPDFLFAGEACYDWELEAYHCSYHRSESKQHVPLSRYMLPGTQFLTAVTGFDDRNMVNQCLLYRYVISYEPYNFKGKLDDYPLTLEYGKRMDALRAELREYFWDGEFRHEAGASVTEAGKPHHPYAVYLSARTGRPGLVIANYDDETPATVDVRLDSGAPLSRYRLVDDPTWRPVSAGVVIPPRSAAVVLA